MNGNSRYLDWGNFADPIIETLKGPAYKWPTAARRTYVLTWPLSFVARGIAIAAVILAALAVGFVGFCANRLSCVWNGEQSVWGD